jgi:hypothetical protein
MIDIVIPLGKSKINHLDLRYALRSIEKFTEAGDIYINGERPKWIKGVEHIFIADDPRKEYKERNIFLKTKQAFLYTDRFLFMNDDHVFLEPTDIENYPNYYKGTCYESMQKNSSNYRQTMNQTRKWLDMNGYPDLNYDGHCPIIFKKKRFSVRTDRLDWNTPFGYGMKSIYAAGLEGEHMSDCKIHERIAFDQAAQRCEGRHVVSFMDGAVKTGLGEYFEKLLPFKSKYERD